MSDICGHLPAVYSAPGSGIIQRIIADIRWKKNWLDPKRIMLDTGLYQTGDYARLAIVVENWSNSCAHLELSDSTKGDCYVEGF